MIDTLHISSKLRLFIAISLPSHLQTDLKRLTQHNIRGLRWSPVDKLHITLHFLGDTKATLIPKLRDGLSQVKAEYFKLTLNDFGFFPGYAKPRVFWLGFNECSALHHLHDQLQDVLDDVGIDTETRPFQPHLTLAKMKKDYHSRRSNSHVSDLAEPFMDREFEIDAFHLYSSDLQPTGAEYTCIHTVPCFNA